MRRRVNITSPIDSFSEKASTLLDRILEHGRRPNHGLACAPYSLAKAFTSLVDSMYTYTGSDVSMMLDKSLWLQVLQLHSNSLRELVHLYKNGDDRAERIMVYLSGSLFIFTKSNVFKAGNDLSVHLARALIRSDSFQCYSQLIAFSGDIATHAVEPILRLLAQISLLFSSCTQVTVSERLLKACDEPTGLRLYAECVRALADSQLLEHMSRALLRIQSAAHTATGIGIDQAINIQRGVMETCGCVVSALHGLAGKQVVVEEVWGSSHLQHQAAAYSAWREVLPEVRRVLSGPCLQFLLGRELVGSRLRLTGGEGPRHGLPDAYLPDLTAALSAVTDAASKQHAAERLLARVGSAALVWQLILTPENAAAAPAAMAMANNTDAGAQGDAAAADGGGEGFALPPGMPYRPVNLYDLLYETLACVVDDARAEHLPGGSQLTLVEPTMLLLRIAQKLQRRHALERLPGLWQLVVRLLRRKQVRLTYSGDRLLRVLGGFLKATLAWQGPAQQQQAVGGAVGAGAEAAGAAAGGAVAGPHAATAGVAAAAAGVAAAAAAGDGVVGHVPGAAEGAPLAPAVNPGISEPDCAFALRCALDGGLLPALEQLLRCWVSDEESCLSLINVMLCQTEIWPAILAHGSVGQVSSLIITLRKMLMALRGSRTLSIAFSSGAGSKAAMEREATGFRPVTTAVLALLAQTLEVLQPRPPIPAGEDNQSAADNRQPAEIQFAAANLQAAVDNAAAVEPAVAQPTAGAVLRPLTPVVSSLALNAAVQPQDAGAVDRAWLPHVGGQTTRGSQASVQQRNMVTFVVEKLLPTVAATVMEAGEGSALPLAHTVLCRYMLLLAYQNLRSRMAGELGQGMPSKDQSAADEGTGAGSSSAADTTSVAGPPPAIGGGASSSSATVSTEGSEALVFYSWMGFLQDGVRVIAWLNHVFHMKEKQEADAPLPPGGKHCDVPLLPAAFDVLELLLLAWAGIGVLEVVRRADTFPDFTRTIVLDAALEDRLLQDGRQPLLAALQWWADNDREGLAGDVDAVGLQADAGIFQQLQSFGFLSREPLATLLTIVLRKHELDAVILPHMHTANMEAEAAGIKLCCNESCINLEGPTEAAISGRKVCSRCRAASYCCGACQLDDWLTSHGLECQFLREQKQLQKERQEEQMMAARR